MAPQFLHTPQGKLAYEYCGGRGPGIVFLPGFRSDMVGSKSEYVWAWCAARGIACTRLDYRAHGQSDGDFRDYTIGGGIEDALKVIDTVTQGPLIVIGSSMGGWIGLHLALQRKERVAGLIGIAAAPDFTERSIYMRMTPLQREMMERDGEISEPGGGDIYTHALIEDGRNHLLLDDGIAIDAPVRLLQGMLDDSVGWQTALEIAGKLSSEDVQLHLVKDGDHRLSREADLALLGDCLTRLHHQLAGS